MPPGALPNLYVTPADVYDYMGTEMAQLRLDDHSQASDQTVQATATAAPGATSLAVTALTSPLLPGSTLEFDGAGMPAVVEVVVTAIATVGATSLTVAPLPAAVNGLAEAFDNGVNTATAARLVKACQYATARVKMYCASRYDDSALAQSWSVNRWALALACEWMCKRRGGSATEGIADDVKTALEEMKQVQAGALHIEDIGTRTSGWPFLSNVTVDIGYDYAKLRVEQPLSEQTPTVYGQFIDWNSALWIEW